jgi:predicted phage terminase large subunit-like protein
MPKNLPNPPEQPGKVHRSFADAMRGAWRRQARLEQVAPPGDWTTWIFCGGRGAGKTRSGAEWVQERVYTGSGFVHLIAPTAADVRDVMLEGPAGILVIAAAHQRPLYQPSLRKVVWPNGAQALVFSADEPDRLRGPQADTVWIDELCAMRTAVDVLDNMYFGLRVGKDPRCLITTTPRPLKCFKALLARDGQDVRVTRSSSFANQQNLAPSFFRSIVAKYSGTRLGKQELEAELLTDTPGALWHLDRIEELRVRSAPQPLERVVVAIDPAVTFGPDSDETGIVVVGLAADGHGYVLDDLSGRYPPSEWAQRAIQAYRMYSADRIIGEVNNGGALVEHTLRSVDPGIPFKAVHASRGKLTRAEPVSALYEQGRIHHVGVFGPLEDQMTSYDGSRTGASPDRLDAAVWGFTELMLDVPAGNIFRQAQLLVGGAPPQPPPIADFLFAVISASDRGDIGTVFFSFHDLGDGVPLYIVDWTLEQFEPSAQWLEGVYGQFEALSVGHRVMQPAASVWLDGKAPLGSALLRIGVDHGWKVFDVMERLARKNISLPDLASRATAALRFVASGDVKISPEAYEKAVTYQGVTRNHLLAQLASFGLEAAQAKPESSELLDAFALGVVIAREGAPPRHARPAAAIQRSSLELSGPTQTEGAAPAVAPFAPPKRVPGVGLKPGAHMINGQRVVVEAFGEIYQDGSVLYPLAPGRHCIDDKCVIVPNPNAGIRIAVGPSW